MLNKFDTYLKLNLEKLSENGYIDENPRGRYESDGEPSHCISIDGGVFESFDLSKGELPITQTRNLPVKMFIGEILTIYQDQSNKISDFEKNKVSWWDNWNVGDGTIGNRYGYTVAKYDLMNKLLKDLKENPYSKRHIMDLYQYEDLNSSDGLHPCAFMTMWTVSKEKDITYLSMTLIQRSSDYLVAGTGVNQVQYVALLMMVAKHLGYTPKLFEHYRHNVHIYSRHLPQLEETITRLNSIEQSKEVFKPKLLLNVEDYTNFYDMKIEDFELVDYKPIKPQLEKFDLAL